MRWIICLLVSLLVPSLLVGCVSRPAAEPAVMSTQAPTWVAPRDAISHISATGLAELSLDADSDPFILDIVVTVDDEPVPLAAFIGIDRLRAVQAPVHTHDDSGDVWPEGDGNREVTLGDFFTRGVSASTRTAWARRARDWSSPLMVRRSTIRNRWSCAATT